MCPNCGEANPERARFCMACAAALTVPDTQEVRKTVTVVFSDLKGSTTMGEALDAESLRDVMGAYFDRMSEILRSHGAAVEKFIGDAIMAVFGLPRLHEDDALRAVRAAWEMQHVLAQLNDELEARWGVRLLARIGVNTGEVVAGDASTGQRLVTGDPVNTAARLEQAAEAGEVLLGDPTWRLVRNFVRVAAVEPLIVKGKAEPLAAYRLLDVSSSSRRLATDEGAPPLVGRERELELLTAALERVIGDRRCESVVVVGEPGIGKSRLLAELEARAAGRARVLHAHCPAYGEGITFWPLGELVRDASGARPGEGVGVADPFALVAELMRGHPDADAAVARVGSALSVSNDPFPLEEVYRGVRMLLSHLAQGEPLVVLIEDTHWAEPAFLDLLDSVGERMADAPVLIVCSERPEASDPRSGSRRWQSVRLEALFEVESDRLIASLLSRADLSMSIQERVRDAAAGNPLYIEQMLSMVSDRSDSGAMETNGHAIAFEVPPTISALISARLDALPPNERSVLERASVQGHAFAREALVELCEPALRPHVDACLRELARKALVDGESGSADGALRYRFRHALIRDAGYAAMLKKVRAELHERFGSWLEQGSDTLPDREELVGYHLERAFQYRTELGPLDEPATVLGGRATALLASAGRRALARGDVGAAANLLRRAERLARAPGADRLAVLVDLGAALRENGDHAAAIGVLEEAVRDAKDQDIFEIECRALVERFEVDMKLDAPNWPERASAGAERLIPRLEAVGDEVGLAKTWRMLSWVHWSRGSLPAPTMLPDALSRTRGPPATVARRSR
jgi:class 3 adenylate cyclase